METQEAKILQMNKQRNRVTWAPPTRASPSHNSQLWTSTLEQSRTWSSGWLTLEMLRSSTWGVGANSHHSSPGWNDSSVVGGIHHSAWSDSMIVTDAPFSCAVLERKPQHHFTLLYSTQRFLADVRCATMSWETARKKTRNTGSSSTSAESPNVSLVSTWASRRFNNEQKQHESKTAGI